MSIVFVVCGSDYGAKPRIARVDSPEDAMNFCGKLAEAIMSSGSSTERDGKVTVRLPEEWS